MLLRACMRCLVLKWNAVPAYARYALSGTDLGWAGTDLGWAATRHEQALTQFQGIVPVLQTMPGTLSAYARPMRCPVLASRSAVCALRCPVRRQCSVVPLCRVRYGSLVLTRACGGTRTAAHAIRCPSQHRLHPITPRYRPTPDLSGTDTAYVLYQRSSMGLTEKHEEALEELSRAIALQQQLLQSARSAVAMQVQTRVCTAKSNTHKNIPGAICTAIEGQERSQDRKLAAQPRSSPPQAQSVPAYALSGTLLRCPVLTCEVCGIGQQAPAMRCPLLSYDARPEEAVEKLLEGDRIQITHFGEEHEEVR
eukprot:2667331-Rhodomonas_salina.1